MKPLLTTFKKNDEWITPPEAVTPLYNEFKFDTKVIDVAGSPTASRNFIKIKMEQLSKNNELVTVLTGDFLNEDFDIPLQSYVVTNPPFSLKDHFIQKLELMLDKSLIRGYALLLPLQALQSRSRSHIFEARGLDFHLRIFKNRIKYYDPSGEQQSESVPFPSCWVIVSKDFRNKASLKWY